jgi:AI-2 transport protein TqsA
MLTNDTHDFSFVKLIFLTAAIVIVVAGMRASASILVPFLFSIFISVIGASPLFWLKSKGWPLSLALIAVVLMIVGIVLLLAILIGTSLDGFSKELPVYQKSLQSYIGLAGTWLNDHGVDVSIDRLKEAFDPSRIMNLANSILSGLGNILSNVILILFTVIFILLESSSVPLKLRLILDRSQLLAINLMVDNLKKYLAVKTIISASTGFTVFIFLTLLDVDFPFLWGMLAFMFNYVPNVGSFIAAIPTMLVTFVQLGPLMSIFVAIGFVVINLVFGTLLEPRIMGRRIGLSTLVVFLSLVFWGWVLGPMGMVLSVPLTMAFKVALDTNDQTRWLAILLGASDDIRVEMTKS